jgi:dephospho-CoA kinase
MPKTASSKSSVIIAFVGMPGSGKSEAVRFLEQKFFKSVRFGDLTEKKLQEQHMPLTPENEQLVREQLRKELGMDAYAKQNEQKIKDLLEGNPVVIIDGLYSWEEYRYLKVHFPQLVLVHVYAEAAIRYQRLVNRPVRPFSLEKAKIRDVAEIENLNKGGPIAIADFLVVNNTTVGDLYNQIDMLLQRLGISQTTEI